MGGHLLRQQVSPSHPAYCFKTRHVDDIFQPFAFLFIVRHTGAISQQDYVRPNMTDISQDCTRSIAIWLARSPDLSPIEHALNTVGHQIRTSRNIEIWSNIWGMPERMYQKMILRIFISKYRWKWGMHLLLILTFSSSMCTPLQLLIINGFCGWIFNIFHYSYIRIFSFN